jgi:hypothetical protein
MSMSFDELSQIATQALILSAQNTKDIANFVTESRLTWGKNERLLAEVHLALKTTQLENQALATNIGRMVEAMNNKGNL